MDWLTLFLRLAVRAAIRPMLAVDLMRTAWAFRRRRWWSAPPYLPLPDPTYLRWRMQTAFGDPAAVPTSEDVIRFARWRRRVMRL